MRNGNVGKLEWENVFSTRKFSNVLCAFHIHYSFQIYKQISCMENCEKL